MNEADLHAIELADADYLLNKGASFYREGNYTLAIEYYRLAALLGQDQALANFGYYHLYRRAVLQIYSLQ
ncbi:hypothetical protein [Streptococcus cuniculi]|uniref:hypothetical protein n=1 Tax=Streptococcus cuniculi TaxID=1432788 RepID=UPI001ABFC812|nr:hypothetical protein [Streptococcus cuniculi]